MLIRKFQVNDRPSHKAVPPRSFCAKYLRSTDDEWVSKGDRIGILCTCISLLLFCLPVIHARNNQPSETGESAVPTAGFQQVSKRVWAFIAKDERSANGALFVGDDEALAVDPGLTPKIAHQFFKEAKAITDRPIKTVVLTHWHPDHALGVILMKEHPFKIVSTPATRRSLAENISMVRRSIASRTVNAEEREELENSTIHLPDQVITEKTIFDLGGLTVECFSPGPGHTDGDLVLWAPSEKTLITGDLFLNKSCPDMEEGSFTELMNDVDTLLALEPEHVIPGHFEVGTADDLKQYRSYLHALDIHVSSAMDRDLPPESLGAGALPGMFAEFRQFPQYRATFVDNARAVAREYTNHQIKVGEASGFTIIKRLKLGQNPHQIAFSPSGNKAFIAMAGSDLIARVDASTLEPDGTQDVGETPLGVSALSDTEIIYTQFGSTKIQRLQWGNNEPVSELEVGEGPSLFAHGSDTDHLLISSERADQLIITDPSANKILKTYPTGKRPFPPSETTDGRLAFIPNYDDGTVTIIDLWNEKVVDTVQVGPHPSGGTVLPGDIEYAVAVRNENKIAIINSASHKIVSNITEGIGESPFSVVTGPFGQLAYVNNTASHDISVISLEDRRVVARIPTGEIPIVMAVHPSGKTLWVSCEGTHEVDIISIPEKWQTTTPVITKNKNNKTTEVLVMGMIHGQHRTSKKWGLEQVRQTIINYNPDVIFPEIPPDRWQRIWSDYSEQGLIKDPRVKLFPEYVDILLPLKIELGYQVEPCAAWTKEMSDLRQSRMKAFNTDPQYADQRAKYEAEDKTIHDNDTEHLTDSDDPRIIHSDAYDEQMAKELEPYDKYLNDLIGPGGWTNINKGHYNLIDEAIRKHPGERILITFGAGHKYWILRELRKRKDIRLVDIRDYLPEK